MNENLGATETEYAFTDMRMFVHDVVLVNTDGQEYPVQIDDDGIWQRMTSCCSISKMAVKTVRVK